MRLPMQDPNPAERWDSAYQAGPPWEIERPQPALVRLAAAGVFTGRVLDMGCGTGEHAMLAAEGGADAIGVDLSPLAIERAEKKAVDRRSSARFLVGNALELDDAAGTFDVVIDSGVFHVFDDDDRRRYVGSVHRRLVPGGRLYLMCFSEKEPGDWGPRRVRGAELRASLANGWRIDDIHEDEFHLRDGSTARAWLAAVQRV